jgi:EcsC protein family
MARRMLQRAGTSLPVACSPHRSRRPRFVAERGVLAEGAPVLVRFIAQVASRFGVVVTQKLAAQAVPVIGAVGGAAVNYAFIDHFQEVARAHFIVRRLERRYGKDAVRAAYERFRSETKVAA